MIPSAVIQDSGLSYVVAVEGLDGYLADFDGMTDRIRKLAARAVNATARKYRTESSREMRAQVAFPARYLVNKTDGRLSIARQATAAHLEAAIRGRFEPTSLARFVKGARTHGRRAPRLMVKPGRTTRIPTSFIMNLRSGNVGLAIRLAPGERIENKRRMVSFSRKDPNLYLLYGPSVDQVFRSVASDVAPDAADYLEREFTRLTESLL